MQAYGGAPQARRAKGINVVDVVKLLRGRRAAWEGARLSAEAVRLLDQHVVMSGWYPLDPFIELLDLSHRRLFGGTDEAAVQMGREGGRSAFGGVHRAFVREGDPARSIAAFGHAWSSYFDFAQATCTVDGTRAEISFDGYPDVTRTHALVIAGWALALLDLAGVPEAQYGILSAPWLGAAELRLELRWS